MVYMEVMMWAIKRELTLVEVDTGKSLLHRAKLRHFVVPLFWWLVVWTKKLCLIETEGPFPNNFHPREFICFQQDNPSFYHRILTNVSVAELCASTCVFCLYHISLFTDVIHNMFIFIIRNNKDMRYHRQQLLE